MSHFMKIFSTLTITVCFLSCSSWALSISTTTTCSSQLRELATQMDEAFSRVFDDVAEIGNSVLTSTAAPPTGRGSTATPVTSIPPSSRPTSRIPSIAPPPSGGPGHVFFSVFRRPNPSIPSTAPPPSGGSIFTAGFRPLSLSPDIAGRLGRRSRSTTHSRVQTLRSLYQNLTFARGEAPSDTVYDQFVSAMSDISQQHFKACYGPSSERVRPAQGPSLISQFNRLRSTSRVHELRAVFAKLLCIRDQNSRVGKRSTSRLEEFFDNLSNKDFGDVFGFTKINAGPIPTGSLAFAVDTTGSMGDEIRNVRRIIRTFVRSEKQEPFYYVLAEFNDYGRESGQCDLERGGKLATAYNSRNLTELNQLVSAIDSLRARGGGDCHEFGMAGILKSLHTHIHPSIPVPALGDGSHIIVLTDAGSKDRSACKNQAIAEAQAKGIEVHFFLSSSGCLTPHAAATYKQVAVETGGVVVENAVDFEALTMFVHRYIELQRKASNNPGSSRGKRSISQTTSTEQRCHLFKVSAFTKSLDLLFNTTKTRITLQKPDGHVIQLSKSNKRLKFFSIEDPKPGTWTACVPSGTLSVSSVLPTDVKFIVSVLQEGTDAAGNTKYYLAPREPYACTTGTVVVRVLEGQIVNISASHNLYLDFLDADKNILQEIPVSACNGLFRGTATFPASMDFLQLRGTDIFGVPFSYIRPAIDAPVTFRPSRFSLMPTSGMVSINSGSTQTLTYQLQAVETEGNTSFSFSVQTATGFTVAVTTTQAVISGSQSITVSIKVTPTSSIARGNYQITLIATSGCNTLRATQTVTVNPQITYTHPVSDQCGGCQNGGTCFSIPWGARVIRRCGCMPGYAGTYCEIAI